MSARFTLSITAEPADIDELGHVNNAVWVRWIQDIAVAHWQAVAPREHVDAFVWVVTRHAIDYRGNVAAGETVTGETWVPGAAEGRALRPPRPLHRRGRPREGGGGDHLGAAGRTGRLLRVQPEVAAPFLN